MSRDFSGGHESLKVSVTQLTFWQYLQLKFGIVLDFELLRIYISLTFLLKTSNIKTIIPTVHVKVPLLIKIRMSIVYGAWRAN